MIDVFSSLPPPVMFTHDEHLHRIPLPPLGTFLSSLTLPEHLVKLNDILDRYRTPKSYHRVDVRVLGSSDLPPVESLAEEEERELREKGEPVVLVEGMDLDTWKALQRETLALAAGIHGVKGGLTPGRGDGANVASESGRTELPDETIYRASPTIKPAPGPIAQLVLDDEDAEGAQIEAAPNPFAVPGAQASLSNDIHLLPPAAPTRRIRELRLDLRTLDAAALFALETWRRQALGLEKLDMDVPDSIWYKDPQPEPVPVPVTTPTARKRGRPRKSATVEVEPAAQTGSLFAALMDDEFGQPEAVADDHTPTPEVREETYQSLVDAIAANGTALAERMRSRGPKEGTEEFALQALETVRQVGATARKDLDTSVVAGPSRLTSTLPDLVPSPSPDIILDDAFNEKEEADPDFVPAAAMRAPEKRSSRRLRLSAPESIDLTRTQDELRDGGLPLGSWTNPIPYTSVKTRKRGRKSDPGSQVQAGDAGQPVVANGSTDDSASTIEPGTRRRGRPPRCSLGSVIASTASPVSGPTSEICELPSDPGSPQRKRMRTTFEAVELPAKRGQRKSVTWSVAKPEAGAVESPAGAGLQKELPGLGAVADGTHHDRGEAEDEWAFLRRF